MNNHRICGSTNKRNLMIYNIKTQGYVPKKIKCKAFLKLESKIHWQKVKRKPWMTSCKVTDCYRLLKIGNTLNLLLMDHKHYNYYLNQ